jgi:hypothetical protein
MAQVTNTYSSYDSARLREEYSDAIHMTSPEETPLLSLLGREKVKGTHPEWNTDTLATPVTSNQQLEGDEYTYSAISPTTRVGNYTEIARKSWLITRTNEGHTKAGQKSELGRERRKKGVELKKDMEASLLHNKASVAGTDIAARVAGGFPSWLTSNDDRDGGGSDGGFNSGTGLTVAASNGSQRAFTKAILDAVILASYNSGGNPTVFMCSPYVKTVFSGLMTGVGIAGTAATGSMVKGKEQATIYAAADTYRSDFGVIDVVPNRVMAAVGATSARNGLLIDPDMAAVGIFDDIFEDKPAKTGDAEKRVLLCEFTLIMKNEAAHGVAADLYGMTSNS